jgi:tetratricopeptide (TPR) repeat protein
MRHLISLGERCDVGFQLRMHGEENVAHFFDWLAGSAAAAIKVFEADFDVFHPDHLELRTNVTPHYVRDRVTGILFYHQFPLYRGNVSPDFLLNYDSFIKKFEYLAARMRDYLRSKPVTLVRRDITQAEALRLEAVVLSQYPEADVQFLYLNHKGDEFTTPRGHCRRLPQGGGSLGDPAVWAEMLLQEGLIETPYRRATAEILGSHHDDYNLATSNRFTEAQLLAAVAANPEHVPYLLELSKWYASKGRHQEAAETAFLALIKAPRAPEVMAHSALMQRRTGGTFTPEMLLEALAAVPAGKPNTNLLLDTAIALTDADRFAEALVLLNKSARLAPLDHRHCWQKAQCLFRTGEFVKAEYALDATLRLTPAAATHYFLRARIMHAQGRAEQALQAARAAQEAFGKSPGFMAWLNLADLFMEIGAGEPAISAYKTALPLAGPHAGTVRKRIAKAEARFGFAAAAE